MDFVTSRSGKLKLIAAVFGLIPLLCASASAIAACTGYPAGVSAVGNVITFVGPPFTSSKTHAIAEYGANGAAGTLVYDETGNFLKLCDGTSWQTVTAGSGSSQWTDGAGGAIYYSGGNVGIGLSNPVSPLNVVLAAGDNDGVIRIEGSTRPSLTFVSTGIQAWAQYIDTADSNKLKIGPANAGVAATSATMTLTTVGNVGIGTTNPTGARLVVDPGINAGTGLIVMGGTAASEGGEIQLYDQGNASSWNIDNFAGTIRYHRGGIAYFTFDTSTAYKPGGGSWAATSDARLKNIDEVYTQGLNSIARLNTIKYHYKKGNARQEPSDRQYVGLVAQDVMKVFPEAVSTGADGYLSLDVTPINFALINAAKDLKAANDNLTSRIDELRGDLESLRREIDGLKRSDGN